jgi:hypothetical protein
LYNVKMTLDYASMAPEKRRTVCEMHVKKMHRKYRSVVDALVVQRIEGGVTLCEAIRARASIDQMELMKTLIFRRYVGTTDTNSNNMVRRQCGEHQVFALIGSFLQVVTPGGRILSVDENAPKSTTLERWLTINQDTVFTAQKNGNLPRRYLESLKVFAKKHEAELVEFLKETRDSSVPGDDEWAARNTASPDWFGAA